MLSYKDTDCFIVCFDISSVESFERLESKWLEEMKEGCGNPKQTFIIVGLKSDFRTNKSAQQMLEKQSKEIVSEEMIKEFVKHSGCNGYIECSALLMVC